MEGILHFHSLFYVLTIFSIILLANLLTIEARNVNHGFSIDLIHRDSPNSPLYNPHETPTQRLNNAFRSSISRLNRLNPTSLDLNTPHSEVISDNGEYLMKLLIGSPPVEIYGIIDTGSDLMWTQCLPCDMCYKQINPFFDPTKSSTYKDIPCRSEKCHLLDTISCSVQTPNVCNYTYGYGGGSLTKGVLATETFTFNSTSGQPFSLPDIVFGCGHNNSGTFNEHEMGLIGLGGGLISLISQIGSSFGSNKFSQCLVPFHTDPSITGKMNFGTGSEVLGDGVVSTPLVTKQDKTYYFITLEGISVGKKFLPYNSSSQITLKGNVFIDSGTPPTILPQDFYNRLEWEVKKAILMEPIKDPELEPQLCYRSKTNIEAPILTAHFDGGANVQLMPMHTFIHPRDDVVCFAMTPTTSDIGVLGNFVQMNFLIGFDLERKMVSFKPTDCTKQ